MLGIICLAWMGTVARGGGGAHDLHTLVDRKLVPCRRSHRLPLAQKRFPTAKRFVPLTPAATQQKHACPIDSSSRRLVTHAVTQRRSRPEGTNSDSAYARFFLLSWRLLHQQDVLGGMGLLIVCYRVAASLFGAYCSHLGDAKETCTNTGAIVTLYIYRIRDSKGNAVN